MMHDMLKPSRAPRHGRKHIVSKPFGEHLLAAEDRFAQKASNRHVELHAKP
jgi:hypothetical protein